MFRIVPNQLRVSEGWLRCGQCDEVFDARHQLRLLHESEPTVKAETLSVLSVNVSAAIQSSDQGAPQHSHIVADYLEPAPSGSQRPDLLQNARAKLGGGDLSNTALMHLSVDQASPAAPAKLALSFMPAVQTQGAKRGVWQSKAMAIVACGVLALLLLAQSMFRQRDVLVARYPPLRPVLATACDVLACTLAPLRQIEAVVIESSTFTRVKDGVYLLHATLKNGTDVDLAAPALELTLNDTQDKPLLRSVIPVHEYSGKPVLLSAGSEMAVNFPFSVQSQVAAQAIVGYKLVVFYP